MPDSALSLVHCVLEWPSLEDKHEAVSRAVVASGSLTDQDEGHHQLCAKIPYGQGCLLRLGVNMIPCSHSLL